MRKSYIGIDLGTTNSIVAHLDASGHSTILHNADGENMTPSVVTVISDNSYEVGREPKKSLWIDSNTFGRFKREMGTNKKYKSHGKSFTPTALSAAVLTQLKKDAEKTIEGIADAVVTIPANFPNQAREATIAAAKKAGLNAKYIINEPTAAAIAYAFQSETALHGNYAIFDLGGGTFDISIVRVVKEKVEVLHSEGIRRLGGDDFDKSLMELVHKMYKSKTGKEASEEDYNQNDAEEDKKTLSKREQVISRVNGKGGKQNISVTREMFEEEIGSYLAQVEMLCEKALSDARLTFNEINEIILVGGSTRIPMVVRVATKVFHKKPVQFSNPDEAVAVGAAIYAAHKSNKEHLNGVQRRAIEGLFVKEITNKFFGVLCLDREVSGRRGTRINSCIIEKGTPIPAAETESYYTVSDGQTEVSLTVTETAVPETDPEKVQSIWIGELDGLPPGRKSGKEIRITYRYDENQIMHCLFEDADSGKEMEIDLNFS